MRESKIEQWLVREVRRRGGLCYKFVSPGNAGVPDRIVICPDGRLYFVELKAERGILSGLQQRQIDRLRSRQQEVRVLVGLEQVKAFVDEEVMPQ